MYKSIYCALLIFMVSSGCRKDDSALNSKSGPDDFLSNKKYEKLIVEIQYISGYPPTATALDNLKAFLQQRLNKSGGISVVQTSIASPGRSSYSLEDIRTIEKENRTQNTDRKTLTAYFFFADAAYAANSGNSKVLGVAYGSSSMVIFEKTIREYSGGLTQPPLSTLETTVIHHEFGHILGLVDNGTSMQSSHQDTPNGKHCDDSNCLMYYTVETSEVVANILGGKIPELDSKCLTDLRANGGK